MSNIRITKNNLSEISYNNSLEFTISGIDVAYANGIRRTIISDIDCLVFKTYRTKNEESKCTIITNTCRLNNEIIKQRLGCIPICIGNINDDTYIKEEGKNIYVKFIEDYILEVDVENNTDEIIYITTKDFKIKDIKKNEYLPEEFVRKIFPPYIDSIQGSREYFIQFVRLRPRISDEIPGEKLKLTCQFDIGKAKDDAMFNVAGTCTYKRTVDLSEMERQLRIQEEKWKNDGLDDNSIKFERKNWTLLDGMRIVVPNSFDFILETIGIYSNETLLKKACNILTSSLDEIIEKIKNEEIQLNEMNNTLPNYYEINFEGYDYTIGNIINHEMYELFFNSKNKKIHCVSTKKLHPHNSYITMEVSLIDGDNAKDNLALMLIDSCESAKSILKNIKKTIKQTLSSENS